ncbi:replication-relaxation family protein [Mesobacillus zeae]|uniref:replication-relaxation family protein n=1 Tax=Mesobacillus zeae TaxID=1917180 RepID=UPI0030089428
MSKRIYRFGKGYSGVWLTEMDIELLYLLWEHRILSLKELKYYSEELYGVKKVTLARKFQRWREEKIVTSKKYGDLTVHYRLAKNGYSILEAEGKIVQGDSHYKELSAPANQLPHFFGIRDVVIRTLVEVRKLKQSVLSLAPATMPYFENGSESVKPIIIPDWIIANSKGFLNLEIDTGTENQTEIEEKIENYVKYTQQRSNEIHDVLIVVMDNKDKYFKYNKDFGKNRSRRVANVKKAVLAANAQNHSNLRFYVSPLCRAHYMACNILTGQSALSAAERSSEVDAIESLLQMNNQFDFEITRLSGTDFYLPEVNSSLYADGHLLLTKKGSDEKKVVLVKIMEEGSTECLDQLNYLNRLQAESRYKRNVDKIIAFYRTTAEFENDSLGKPPLQNVIFGIKEELMRDMGASPFTKNPSEFKKGIGTPL